MWWACAPKPTQHDHLASQMFSDRSWAIARALSNCGLRLIFAFKAVRLGGFPRFRGAVRFGKPVLRITARSPSEKPPRSLCAQT